MSIASSLWVVIIVRRRKGWGVVQSVARGTLDPEVPGSKPGAPAIVPSLVPFFGVLVPAL